ncbi:hypothetical protein ElyMa_003417200 [Elysia marginata]|uniref:Uncharacterized protein n=1 Tax=Elysia marginata TaxID=1093978 RepID=A0AAV4JR97_9GAST|nr:hypothetical protein ElyMa_003417200 [Elysia marginata]
MSQRVKCFTISISIDTLLLAGRISKKIIPLESQNTVAITFVADYWTLNFFVTGEEKCFHVIESHFVSGVLRCNQVSSPVMGMLRSLFLVQWSPPGATSTVSSPSC